MMDILAIVMSEDCFATKSGQQQPITGFKQFTRATLTGIKAYARFDFYYDTPANET
jgi:hypothetical protein